jgi:hypothetical protein
MGDGLICATFLHNVNKSRECEIRIAVGTHITMPPHRAASVRGYSDCPFNACPPSIPSMPPSMPEAVGHTRRLGYIEGNNPRSITRP